MSWKRYQDATTGTASSMIAKMRIQSQNLEQVLRSMIGDLPVEKNLLIHQSLLLNLDSAPDNVPWARRVPFDIPANGVNRTPVPLRL